MGDDAGGCVVMAIASFPHPANDNVLYVRGREEEEEEEEEGRSDKGNELQSRLFN